MKEANGRDELFGRVCDGIATAGEISDLHRMLRLDSEALDAWLRYSALHGELAGGTVTVIERDARLRALPLSPVRMSAPLPVRQFWSQWRSLTSAAAGLVFGLFTATVVLAYVAPFGGRQNLLLDEGFESALSPLVTRVPLEPGIWRGNKAEIVSEQQGVKPATGQKMLRFLREDSDGKPRASGGHIADVYRLIDVREFHHEVADGGGVVQASASVNAKSFPEHERYGCAISIYALDSETIPDSANGIGMALTGDANAMARSSRAKLDRDPATWQRLTTELRLPPGTEFIVVRLHINQLFESDSSTVFTGSYADDVRVTLTRRAPTP